MRIEQEMKDRFQAEKLRRHQEKLEKIAKQGEDRKIKIIEAEKAYKEIN